MGSSLLLQIGISFALELNQQFHGPQPFARCGVGIVSDFSEGFYLCPDFAFFLHAPLFTSRFVAPSGLNSALVAVIRSVPPSAYRVPSSPRYNQTQALLTVVTFHAVT